MNLTEIIEAWSISFHPNEKQKELAKLRGEVCLKCPSRKKIIVDICSECGCPISKKIFTNEYNPCPLKKWGQVDEGLISNKENKTLL